MRVCMSSRCVCIAGSCTVVLTRKNLGVFTGLLNVKNANVPCPKKVLWLWTTACQTIKSTLVKDERPSSVQPILSRAELSNEDTGALFGIFPIHTRSTVSIYHLQEVVVAVFQYVRDAQERREARNYISALVCIFLRRISVNYLFR